MSDIFPKLDPERLMAVLLACAELSTSERLDVLQVAWLVIAANARTEAPAGFVAEQARQVARLRALAEAVAAAVPDSETDRLAQEGDAEGVLRRAEQLLARDGDVQ